MERSVPSVRWTTAALQAGVAVPFIYYGIQALAAPFFPGFRFVSTTASELGSDLSKHPALFNLGILIQGFFTLVAALGVRRALTRLGTHTLLVTVCASIVALTGIQTLWAGCFPMPDPRHGGHPIFIVGMLLLPLVSTYVVWRHSRSFIARSSIVAALVLLVMMVPIMSGISGIDTHAYRGMVQRVFTLSVYPPLGLACFVLARRIGAHGSNKSFKPEPLRGAA